MALSRYEPWSIVGQLQDDINRTLRGLASSGASAAQADFVPRADVEEYSDRFRVLLDLPGVVASDVAVTLDDGVLTVSGERKAPDAAGEVLNRRRERGLGRFERRFVLPPTVDADGVEARERGGVLEITIPKQAAAQPRRIPIAA